MQELGLQEVWQRQAVDGVWRETVKHCVMKAEGVRWSSGASKNARLENYVKWKTCLLMGLEPYEYLSEPNDNRRRLWSKLMAGYLELRAEPRRWERLTVVGVQRGGDIGKQKKYTLFFE